MLNLRGKLCNSGADLAKLDDHGPVLCKLINHDSPVSKIHSSSGNPKPTRIMLLSFNDAHYTDLGGRLG